MTVSTKATAQTWYGMQTYHRTDGKSQASLAHASWKACHRSDMHNQELSLLLTWLHERCVSGAEVR